MMLSLEPIDFNVNKIKNHFSKIKQFFTKVNQPLLLQRTNSGSCNVMLTLKIINQH